LYITLLEYKRRLSVSGSSSVFEKLHEAVDEAVRELVLQVLKHYAESVAELKRELLELAVEAKLALVEGKTETALEKLSKITAILD
jgi:predicted RecB family endonuclease